MVRLKYFIIWWMRKGNFYKPSSSTKIWLNSFKRPWQQVTLLFNILIILHYKKIWSSRKEILFIQRKRGKRKEKEESGKVLIYSNANIWSYHVIVHEFIKLEGFFIFHSMHTHVSWSRQKKKKEKATIASWIKKKKKKRFISLWFNLEIFQTWEKS